MKGVVFRGSQHHFLFATLIVLAGFGRTTSRAWAGDLAQEAPPVYIYFFWGDGCPHCADAKPFLQELAERYPNVQVESFEVWYVAENRALFQQMAAAHDFEPRYVPTFFIGERQWEGFSKELRQDIEATVLVLLVHRKVLPRFGIIIGTENLEGCSTFRVYLHKPCIISSSFLHKPWVYYKYSTIYL